MNKFLIAICLLALAISIHAAHTGDEVTPLLAATGETDESDIEKVDKEDESEVYSEDESEVYSEDESESDSEDESESDSEDESESDSEDESEPDSEDESESDSVDESEDRERNEECLARFAKHLEGFEIPPKFENWKELNANTLSEADIQRLGSSATWKDETDEACESFEGKLFEILDREDMTKDGCDKILGKLDGHYFNHESVAPHMNVAMICQKVRVFVEGPIGVQPIKNLVDCFGSLTNVLKNFVIPELIEPWSEMEASDLTEEDIKNVAHEYNDQVASDCHQVEEKLDEIYSHMDDEGGSCSKEMESGKISDHPVVGPVMKVARICHIAEDYVKKQEEGSTKSEQAESKKDV